MFKPLSRLIHRTPWWALLVGGATTLLILLLFAAPLQVLQLTSRDGTPEEKRAIQREIDLAFKDSGLSVAEEVLGSMRERAQDPQRQRDLDRALAEIARARGEDVKDEAERAARDSAIDALDAAQEAAQAAREAAEEALQAVEESRTQALDGLRAKGLDVSGAERSFDEMIKTAKDKVVAAQGALDGIARSREQVGQSGAAPVLAPTPPTPPLAPGVRDSIRHRVMGDMWRAGIGSALILAFIPLFVLLLVAKYFIDRSNRVMAFAEEKKEEAQVSDMQRQMTEARLQALQAQVEPHFLYNTLANVQALTEIDPPAANKLVGHLIEYLRAALPKMRESTSTVGQEVERVRAYLNILKMRMAERLEFGIHVHDSLLGLPFPPMMLPTLVENAIKHGLEPRREGGRIDVMATRVQDGTQDRLVMQVKDTGAGLTGQEAQTGSGVGLSNLRERLQGLYGEQGRFMLQANEPQGVVGTIDIPVGVPTQFMARTAANTSASAVAQASLPTTGWRRVWGVTRKTHGVWAQLLSRIFVVLMIVLLIIFFAGLIGVLTGWLPIEVHNYRLDGVEGMALGSLGLLLAFGVVALVIALVLLLLYGMGFLFAGLLIFIPAVIVVSMSPALAPFILIGLVIYWLVRRGRTPRDGGSKSAKE